MPVEDTAPFGGVWDIAYRDGEGEVTNRTVEGLQLRWDGDDCELTAFCRLRQAERTFWTSRILAMKDAETGDERAALGGVAIRSAAIREREELDRYLSQTAYLARPALQFICADKAPQPDVARDLLRIFPPGPCYGNINPDVLAHALSEPLKAVVADSHEFALDVVSGLEMLAQSDDKTRVAVASMLRSAATGSGRPYHEIVEILGKLLPYLGMPFDTRR